MATYTYTTTLENVQRKFAKYLVHTLDGEYPVRGYPNDLLLQRVQIPSLSNRNIYFSIKCMHQLFNSLIDTPHLLSKFWLKVPSFGCRKYHTFEVETAITNIVQFFPTYRMLKNDSSFKDEIDIFDHVTKIKIHFYWHCRGQSYILFGIYSNFFNCRMLNLIITLIS